MRRLSSALLLVAVILAGLGVIFMINALSGPREEGGVPVYGYRVVAAYPHDTGAFTEGLVYAGGYLYEGTGLNGRSSLRQEDLETGAILRSLDLPSQYFGEGITILNGEVYQLTWQSHTGFIYSLNFTELGNFSYATEGWGLTNNGTHLIMSDGTSNLYFLDPATLTTVSSIAVTDGGKPVTRLNELEYVRGEIWANVWQTDLVARISPVNGSVLAWVDLGGLLSPSEKLGGADVINGIAYVGAGDRIFVTGKLWPHVFQIDLVPKA